MPHRRSKDGTILTSRPTTAALALLALVGAGWGIACAPATARAAEHTAGFDGEETALKLRFDTARTKLLSHRRNRYVLHSGRASENVEFVVGEAGARVWLEYVLPPARVIDDLELGLWLKANRPGTAIALRVILPHHRDPRDGAVLSTYVPGDVYTDEGKWQRLGCKAPTKAVEERLRFLRAKLDDSAIDGRDMYVDRVVIQADLPPGTTEFFVDDLSFGPIVDPRREATVVAASATEAAPRSHVDFRLDQLHVEGRPFFPTFVPYHGEAPESLADLGFNGVFVPRYDDHELLAALRRQKLWAIATPPLVTGEDGGVLDGESASLMPLGKETEPILLWLGGTRVKPERRADLVSWAAQIRQADRLDRPMMLDVVGDERQFSRSVRMLGVTRHPLNGTFSLRSHHDWLVDRSGEAWPGSFLWTWIQTEPSPSHGLVRTAAGRRPVVVEPEQIRLQTYGALAAGCRGVGFWSRTPLDGNTPGDEERRLAIRQLNLEMQLLAPLLATSSRDGSVTFGIPRGDVEIERKHIDFQAAGRGRNQRNKLLQIVETERKQALEGESQWEAAVLRTPAGTLILPVWYGNGAQFVPGQMAGNDAYLLLAGTSDTATAWEITTTGIRSLGRGLPGPGGRTIKLPKFDQTAAILVTTDRDAIDQLRARIAPIAQLSSRTQLDLARAKLARVEETSRQLRELGVAQPDAPQLLDRARGLVARAAEIHERGNYDAARELSADTLQLLRILQRADWENAVHGFVSPVSSPHTLCHETLPDHWRMIAQIGRSPFSPDDNLLRSGDFEDLDTMQVAGWWHGQNEGEGFRAATELTPHGKQGRYALRMIAVADRQPEGKPPIEPPRESPVVLRTPAVPVRGGQLVHVSGWFRYYAEGPPHPDGAVVYDNLLGSTAALRLGRLRGEMQEGWRRFELIREVHRSGKLTITFALNGFGELHLDDVRVVPLDPRPADPPPTAMPPRNGYGTPLDLWNRLPSIPTLPGFGRGTPEPTAP